GTDRAKRSYPIHWIQRVAVRPSGEEESDDEQQPLRHEPRIAAGDPQSEHSVVREIAVHREPLRDIREGPALEVFMAEAGAEQRAFPDVVDEVEILHVPPTGRRGHAGIEDGG